jgi:hypothetical protein
MSEAHKYPCGDKSCPQTFCMSDRIRQDQNMGNCREIDTLRTRIDALESSLRESEGRAVLAMKIFYAITQEDGDDIDAIAKSMSAAAQSGLGVLGMKAGDKEPAGWRNWPDEVEALSPAPAAKEDAHGK